MKRIKSFTLAGLDWTVKYGVKSTKWYGRTHTNVGLIEISTKCKTKKMEQLAFYHELFHAIAGTLGDKKLDHDEYKIEALARLLSQFHDTKQH